MSEQQSDASAGMSRLPLVLAGVVLVTVLVCCGGLTMLVGGVAGGAAGAQEGAATASKLRPDAPIPPQYLEWVLRAGSICPELGPAEIAAQIDLESSWNPNSVAHNPPERGGDAMGIAQFQAATWATWGGDYDHDGQNSPYDPEDAIVAMGRLMCDNVAWAKQMLATKPTPKVQGDVLDLAWAAYFDGRGGILAAGGVPASGPAHDYPQQVRDRLSKYALDTGGDGLPPGNGGIPAGWTPPTNAQQATAVNFALAQLGKPYVFGAEGPDSYDCSGLVMAAWAAAGVHLPHSTYAQAGIGIAVPSLDAMQPGDLILIAGSDGTMAHPGHVGMYIGRGGDGRQYLVQAPHTGTVVQVSPVWSTSLIAAIRRP